MHRLASRLAAAALLAAFAPTPSPAVDLADGKLNVGGSASWGYLRTDANKFLELADNDGDWNTANFDLLAIAKPIDNVTLTAQFGFDPTREGGAKAELEWVFGEYRLSDLFRLRAGKVKQPFGNYSELQFIGVARPFYDLPTSIYGPANVTASSYSGVGVTGEWIGERGFGIQYDLYGGALLLELFEPFIVLTETPPPDPLTFEGIPIEDEKVENLLGGRVSLTTPWEVTLRLSGYGSRERDGERVSNWVYAASAFHRGEKLWVSAEVARSTEAFRASNKREDQIAAYAEAAYFVTPKAQVALRYDRSRLTLEGTEFSIVPSYLLDHDEVAAGLNWWFTPQVVAKLSVHRIWGNRFTQVELDSTGSIVRPKDSTLMFVAGTQFTF